MVSCKGKVVALLDTGASTNFISKDLVEKLDLKIQSCERVISLGKGVCNSVGSVELVMQDDMGNIP